MSDGEEQLGLEQAAFIARARRLMMIASLTTVISIGAVFAVIGYRVFHLQGSGPVPAASGPPAPIALAPGAKVVSSAIGEDRLVLTVEARGGLELLSFDLQTLKLLARQRVTQP